MKKTLFIMTFAALLASCGNDKPLEKSQEEAATAPTPLVIDNALTDAEKAARKFTPEVMWKMSRIGSQALSPDGSKLIYSVTQYNLQHIEQPLTTVARQREHRIPLEPFGLITGVGHELQG